MQLTREIETFLSRKFLIFIILLLKWIQIDGEKKQVSFVPSLAYLPGNMHLSMSIVYGFTDDKKLIASEQS